MSDEEVINASIERLESILEPVNGGVGEDISYDDLFEKVKGEVDKLQSLEGGKVDWAEILTITTELLEDKSIDFRVGCYFATAKGMLDGLQGLVDGMVCLRELTNKYWEEMYPPTRRIKARANLLSWYADIVGPEHLDYQPTLADRPMVMAGDALSKEIDALFREKMADSYTGIGALRELYRNLVQKTPEEPPPPPPPPEPKSEPPPPPPPPVATAAAPAASAPAAAAPAASAAAAPLTEEAFPKQFADVNDANQAASEISLSLSGVAETLRAADPANPEVYRLGRIGAWMLFTELPEHEDNQTELPPPPEDVAEELKDLADKGDWMELLNAADKASSDFIYWLDPNRYCALAMDNLGALFIKAKETLLFEVAAVLARHPQLADLSFSDGTALADASTKAWLEEEVYATLSAGGGGGPRLSPVDLAIAEAKGKAENDELTDALNSLRQAASKATSRADRFKLQLAMATITLDAAQFDIARAQLASLERIAKAHNLADWDPPLAAQLYRALYEARKGENDGSNEPPPEAIAEELAAFDQLCTLDPASAVRLRTDG